VQPLLQWESNEYYTTSVYLFVALGIQDAMRTLHIAICGLPRSLQYFSNLSHKR